MERWKVIKAYPKYSVSDKGRVINNHTGKILKPALDSCGYPFVCLCLDGRKHCVSVHRLVAGYFIPNPENLPEVNHKNNRKTDNRVENLEWCTHAKNINLSFEMGRNIYTRRRAVQCIETGIIYPSIRAAARAVGVSDIAIHKVIHGKTHRAGGLHWQTVETLTVSV